MKKAATLKNRIISASLAFAMLALCFTFLSVITPGTQVSAHQFYDGTYTVSGSNQRLFGFEYASDANVATVTIDESKLVTGPDLEVVSNVEYLVQTSSRILQYNAKKYNTPEGEVDKRLPADSEIVLKADEEGKPAAVIKYKNAAVMPDGTRKNVVIRINEIHLFTRPGRSSSDEEITIIADNGQSDSARKTLVDFCTQMSSSATNPHVGVKVDMSLYIEGVSDNDTFFFSLNDINIDRTDSSNGSGNHSLIHKASENYNFSETVVFPDDFSGTLYLHENRVSGGYDTERIISAGLTPEKYNLQYSQVAALINAKNGIDFTLIGSATGSGSSDIYILPDGMTHTTTASSGVGGKIELWKTGVIDDGAANKLLDSSDSSVGPNQPRTFDIPDGKVITYKITPDNGSTLDKIYVFKKGGPRGSGVGPTQTFYKADGSVDYYTVTIDYQSFPGLFNFNNEIRVEWLPASELVIKRADGKVEQDFWYTVEGTRNGVTTTIEVCIPAGSDTATVKGVYPNETYTVTEKNDWSWRYPTELVLSTSSDALKSTSNVTGGTNIANVVIVSDAYSGDSIVNNNIVVFKYPRNDNEWLGGYNLRKNHYTLLSTDPVTQDKWAEFLYGTTQYTGMVWSDKSLTTADSTTISGAGLTPITINKASGADFLVDFSLFSSTVRDKVINSDETKVDDLDIVFVVDRSTSMNTVVDNVQPTKLYNATFNFGKNAYTLYNSFVDLKNSNPSALYYKDPGTGKLLQLTDVTGSAYTFSDGVTTKLFTIQDSENISLHTENLYTTSASYRYLAYKGITELAENLYNMYNLGDKNTTINMALVGFAQTGGTYMGTGLYYVNSSNSASWQNYVTNTATMNARYPNAFFTLADDAGYNSFIDAAGTLLSNSGSSSYSYVNRGLEMANKIFGANTQADETRKNRVVILIKGGTVIGNGAGSYNTVINNGALADANSILTNYNNDPTADPEDKNTARIYSFGFFPGIDVTGGTSTNVYNVNYDTAYNDHSGDPTWMTNWMLYNLSSNKGAPIAGDGTNYFLDGTSETAAGFASEFAKKSVDLVYDEGDPLATYAGTVTYTDALGDYMQIAEGEMTLVAFGKEYKLNYDGSTVSFVDSHESLKVTNDLGEEIYLDEKITFEVVTATLKDGDVIRITVDSSAIPLRCYEVTNQQNSYTCKVERDRPLHVFYSAKLKDEAKKFLDDPESTTLNEMEQLALKSYIRRNTHDNGTVLFYSNKFVPGAEEGSATTVFTPGNTTDGGINRINHFYYFASDKSPLYELDSNGLKQKVTGVTYADIKNDPGKYFFEIERYDFNDPRLADGAMPESGVEYIAKKTVSVHYLDSALLAQYEDHYGVSDDDDATNIGKYLTTDSDGSWYIPRGAVKFVHKDQLSYGKSENITDTAKMALTDDPKGNSDGSITVTEYLGNNGLIYYSRNNNG